MFLLLVLSGSPNNGRSFLSSDVALLTLLSDLSWKHTSIILLTIFEFLRKFFSNGKYEIISFDI